jgi:hypothetical protein
MRTYIDRSIWTSAQLSLQKTLFRVLRNKTLLRASSEILVQIDPGSAELTPPLPNFFEPRLKKKNPYRSYTPTANRNRGETHRNKENN